jgi:hypothetical protein
MRVFKRLYNGFQYPELLLFKPTKHNISELLNIIVANE